MTRARAAAGSLGFLVLAPGVVAGVVPWLLTGWDSSDPPLALQVLGALLIAAGAGVLLSAFARFVVEGIGTPAPVAPPEHLVVGGLYRHVRNPMYVAVAATIVGQAALLGSTGPAALRPGVHGRGRELRVRLRATGAERAIRGRLRPVSTQRSGLVAAPQSLEGRR